MSRAAKLWAIKARRELMDQLGNRCVRCGLTEYTLLQFDHKRGKNYSSRGLSTDQRMCRYRREHREGLLQILCLFCNASKGRPVPGETDAELLQDERDAINIPEYFCPVVPQNEDDPY